MGLSTTDASTNRVDMAAAASINNITTGTTLMWMNLGSTAPATQRNFWGKSSGNNRYVGTINSTSIQGAYGGGTSLCNANALTSNMPNFGANKWVCLAHTFDFGGANPHLYSGDLSNAMQEATSYVTQVPGSGTHDDSGSGWTWFGAAGGGNCPGGKFALAMVWSGRQLSLGELIDQQFHPHKTSGLVVYLQFGYNGTSTQPDWSGNGNSGTVTGATLTPDHVPLMPPFGFDIGWQGAFTASVAGARANMLPLLGVA